MEVGDATGFAMLALFKPVEGDQENVGLTAEVVANRFVEVPAQIETLLPAFTVGLEFTITVTLEVAVHPFAVAVTE